jgi:ribulose-5-phosphate 4-epimerase/fuculose-1-phosphate aldolase
VSTDTSAPEPPRSQSLLHRAKRGAGFHERDIIENDLDGRAISGNRPDQYEERFIDAAIYKARPDVMTIVHTHSPELISFSVSSTPLPSGGGAVPVFDVRTFNNGRIAEITTPELGRSLAEALGRGNAILLLGHGAVTGSTAVPAAISGANSLRRGALLQMQMVAMGGKINPNPREFPEGRVRAPAPAATPAPAPSQASGALDTRNNAGDPAWDHWRRAGARLVQSTSITNTPAIPDRVQAIKRDLAIASRILSIPQLGIMDTGRVTSASVIPRIPTGTSYRARSLRRA